MAKKKILIVDDEVSFTRPLRASLERTGKFEVRTEDKGAEAVRAARSFLPDLIVLEVTMPDVGGSEIANRLKNDPLTQSTPILFLTEAVRDHEINSRSSAVGGYFFLGKPVTTDALIRSIEVIVGASGD